MPEILSFGRGARALGVVVLAALALPFAAPAGAATFYSSVGSSIRTTDQPLQTMGTYGNSGAGEIRSLTSELIVGQPNGSAAHTNAWGQSGWGWVKAYAQGDSALNNSTSQPSESKVDVGASASFSDTFIITCPTCVEGSVGRLYGGVGGTASRETRDGGRDAGGWFQTQTTWSLGVTIRSEGIPYDWENQFDSSYDSSGGWETHLLTPNSETVWGDFDGTDVSIEFVFGKPIHVSFGLSVDVLAWSGSNDGGGQSWSAGLADSGHTLAWGGLVVFTDDGQVNNFTAFNAQGMDYAVGIAAIPEPGTWALMAGGLALLGALARRRRV